MRSKLIAHLPAIFHNPSGGSLLPPLLDAFERILIAGDPDAPGLEEAIEGSDRFLDPGRTPSEFLYWLSGWVALSVRVKLSEARVRRLIASVVPLYGSRGTPHGMKQMIELFTSGTAEIDEPEDWTFQIGDHSTIGKDTYLGGPAPHVFRVRYRGSERDGEPAASLEIVSAVIELAKPAHTSFVLEELQDHQE